MLTVAEVAERLQVHPQTVYALIASGELPARRIGHQIRISPERLAEWLNQED